MYYKIKSLLVSFEHCLKSLEFTRGLQIITIEFNSEMRYEYNGKDNEKYVFFHKVSWKCCFCFTLRVT